MLLGTAVCFPTRHTACFRRPGRFQGHGCVPLHELFLPDPTGGGPGDPRRLALRKGALPFFVTPGALPFFVIPGALPFFMIPGAFRKLL